jgi:thioredoxin reductase (NADPH)
MEKHDVIIIGGGSAGLPAAVYSARFNLKTLVLVKEMGGLLTLTHLVENWPGEIAISGFDLMEKIEKHAKSYDLVDVVGEEALSVEKKDDQFLVKTNKGEYTGKAVIFATGTKRKKLGVTGEKEFENKGVSYCATCDAPLYKDKVVAVVGGSDSAAKEALLLTEHCKKVYVIYRKDKIRAEPINMNRVEKVIKEGKLEVINNTNIIEVKGENFVNKVILDNEFNGSKELELEGVFIEIGGIPQVSLVEGLGVELNDKKEIVINENSETSVKGVFAAGDVANKEFKQAITGAAEGVIAAFATYKYINEQEAKGMKMR